MAADVITRFKLETTQFDSKLRDTAKQLQSIARQAEKAGKDFSGFDKGAIEAARALGTVASGATNAKDKLRDLVGSFNDAAKVYNSLSEEAKKGEFGKAMAASLQKLQQDIKQTKEELYGLSEEILWSLFVILIFCRLMCLFGCFVLCHNYLRKILCKINEKECKRIYRFFYK